MPATPLASWKDGRAKQAIVDFVTSAVTPGPEQDPSLADQQPYDEPMLELLEYLKAHEFRVCSGGGLFAATGRLSVLTGGNADVDIEMLTAAKFSVLVNHDDSEREFACTSGAEQSLLHGRTA